MDTNFPWAKSKVKVEDETGIPADKLCNPAYFKTRKHIQKQFDAYLANPGGTLPTYKSQLWLVLDQYQDKWLLNSHSHPTAHAMVAAWVANGPCRAQAPRLVAIEKITCVCVS